MFQFVDQTWLSTLKQHGTKYGYGRYAELITKGADGRYHVEGADARKAVMDLKLDPHAASLMAGELASDHASYLRGRTGRAPTGGELYAAHFLGPQGSARLIEAVQSRPGATAASLFPEAAASNRSIFYHEGRPATVTEVYANLTRAAGGGEAHTPPPAQASDAGFIQYASARQADRKREQDQLVDLILRGSQDADTLGAVSGAQNTSRLSGSLFSTEMLRVLSEASHDKRS